MSTKAVNQQQRRTPLSLTGGVGKSNQTSGKSADTNGNSNNGASAKNDNKLTASQKVESGTNNVDTKESTSKDVKKAQNNTDKRQSQQQNANSNDTTKKNEKVEEKKTQNGAGKVATNGGAKEKQQNGGEKQENGNSNDNGNASNTRSSSTSSNNNAATKTTTKSNEKSATTTANVKEESKAQEQKPGTKGTATRSNEKATPAPTAVKDNVNAEEQKPTPTNEKNDKESEKEKKKDSAPEKNFEKETRPRRNDTATVEIEKKQTEKVELPSTRSSAAQPKARAVKDNVNAEEQKPTPTNEKNDKESEKEKKKDSAPEKNFEKETRSRRNDTATVEIEKKQTEKVELPSTRSSAAQPKARATPTKGIDKSSGVSTPTKGIEKSSGGGTPAKSVEKSSGASTPTKAVAVEKSSASQRIRSVTTDVDDVEMEVLAVELSPEKPQKNSAAASAVAATIAVPPAATSTPGKQLFTTQQKTKSNQNIAASKSELALNVQKSDSPPDRNSVPRTFTQIGGRRSIRPLTEYTPSKFQSNLQYRESYRRINTELDVSSTTNTSMNVTVGSEVPNNSSFSFFGRGRKRDRTPPPQQQSTMELHNDADYSPPKRARLDMQMFFSAVASPLTLLRSRFSKTSIQSSTPVKLSSKLTADEDEAEVQNVSGISIEEEINENAESVEKTATQDVTVGKKVDDDTTPKQLDSPMKVDEKSGIDKDSDEMINAEKELVFEPTNVHEVAAGIADTSVTLAKNKRCNVM